MQVLIVAPDDTLLGTSAIVKITSVGRWSVFGEVIETIEDVKYKTYSRKGESTEEEKCSDPCSSTYCASSIAQETCACGGTTMNEESVVSTNPVSEDGRGSRNVIGWLLRNRKSRAQKNESEFVSGLEKRQSFGVEYKDSWNATDRVLLGGILVSFLIIVALLVHLGIRT